MRGWIKILTMCSCILEKKRNGGKPEMAKNNNNNTWRWIQKDDQCVYSACKSSMLSRGLQPCMQAAAHCCQCPAALLAAHKQHSSSTFCIIPRNTHLCLEIRVKIFIYHKGEETGFKISVHKVFWKSQLFLAGKKRKKKKTIMCLHWGAAEPEIKWLMSF